MSPETPSGAPRLPDPSDLALLCLEIAPDARRARFRLQPELARPDGALYGGTATAVSVAAMEAATGRPGLWVTTQFVSQTRLGALIDCAVEVHAQGRRVSQCEVRGREGDRLLFVSLGSTAVPAAGGVAGQFLVMPKVTPPDQGPPMPMGAPAEAPGAPVVGFGSQVEYRVAEALEASPLGPDVAMWARLTGDRPVTRAAIAFLADMVPVGVARAAGLAGGGISLDHSLRFGSVASEPGWLLLELRGHLANGSQGHGSVRVWTEDGRLVAVGGQSANMASVWIRPRED